ncbi:MAG: hypothetical protein OXT09_02695, partial [Myxococcales bacterium]|nr:hypothetical protein [Myxococcales bacterium]
AGGPPTAGTGAGGQGGDGDAAEPMTPAASDEGTEVDGGAPSDAGQEADGTTPPVDGGTPSDGATTDAGDPDAGAVDEGPNVDRTNPDLHEHVLDPSVLDPAADQYIADQFAQLDTRAEPLGKLVFFLPGANNSPGDWRNHGRKLAEMGFHVVIPHYNNAWGSACSGQGGSCNEDTRWEALTGEAVSGVVDISRANSAEARVLAMLEHLTTANPGGDWGYYLNDDSSLRDSEVIIAGISHGASSAGLFGTRRTFWRVVMHSGGWWDVGDSPATPISEYYGLSHTGDPQHDGHLSSWASAGLPGDPTSIDGQSAPYGGAHQLITSEPNDYPHCSVVVHGSSPTAQDGSFIFEPAWRHMYGVAGLLE